MRHPHSFRGKLTREEYRNLQRFIDGQTVNDDFKGDGLDAEIVGGLICRGLIYTPGNPSRTRAFIDFDNEVQARKAARLPPPTGGVVLHITRRGTLMLQRCYYS